MDGLVEQVGDVKPVGVDGEVDRGAVGCGDHR